MDFDFRWPCKGYPFSISIENSLLKQAYEVVGEVECREDEGHFCAFQLTLLKSKRHLLDVVIRWLDEASKDMTTMPPQTFANTLAMVKFA